jgi:tRNA modification GTPase
LHFKFNFSMKTDIHEDTIAAVATPPGIGALSIIRLSGPDSIEITDKIFSGKKTLMEAESHTLHYGKLVDTNGIIDDVVISVFRKPNSYTGEESIEITSHGNPFIQTQILELLVKRGVRLAEPGEFTRRAYLNNRMDLAQAEAVADLISSSSQVSLRGARNQLDGLLSSKVRDLRGSLINISSLLELELDFAEEELEFVDHKEISGKIGSIIKEIDGMLKTFSFGKYLREGINTAIVGKPNTGKSSLLNYLLKESRAIVSSTPGTTRDIIREDLLIDGLLFRLFDTAGIRVSEDEIEIEGVSRSRNAVKNADLVLFMYDALEDFPQELYKEVLGLHKRKEIMLVLNKIDLKSDASIQPEVMISAKTGEGVEGLLQTMKQRAFSNTHYTEKSIVVTNIRHKECLERANQYLLNAKRAADENLSGEFIASDMRNAVESLSEIIGEVTTNDILNNIFMNFCIGK